MLYREARGSYWSMQNNSVSIDFSASDVLKLENIMTIIIKQHKLPENNVF
jgi:hypothetical protein